MLKQEPNELAWLEYTPPIAPWEYIMHLGIALMLFGGTTMLLGKALKPKVPNCFNCGSPGEYCGQDNQGTRSGFVDGVWALGNTRRSMSPRLSMHQVSIGIRRSISSSNGTLTGNTLLDGASPQARNHA